MPLLASDYRAPFYLFNGHLETIVPSLFKKAIEIDFQRARLELSDGDFLDIDWLNGSKRNCIIFSHGLEGSSDRPYVKRTARYFSDRGWSVLAWNCRSCSGEPNRLPRFYHHGDTADLSVVVQHAADRGFENIILIGYSMGGSMSLKYLGENIFPKTVKGAITFSVPCNLEDSALELSKRSNRFYEQRFLKKLLHKIETKAVLFPEILKGISLDQIQTFDDFHRHFTVPLHGFENLEDFFSKATCDQFFDRIQVPVLIVNAKNDPMLGAKCYPVSISRTHQYLYLEMPERGGHVGFSRKQNGQPWMEARMERFISEVIFSQE